MHVPERLGNQDQEPGMPGYDFDRVLLTAYHPLSACKASQAQLSFEVPPLSLPYGPSLVPAALLICTGLTLIPPEGFCLFVWLLLSDTELSIVYGQSLCCVHVGVLTCG